MVVDDHDAEEDEGEQDDTVGEAHSLGQCECDDDDEARPMMTITVMSRRRAHCDYGKHDDEIRTRTRTSTSMTGGREVIEDQKEDGSKRTFDERPMMCKSLMTCRLHWYEYCSRYKPAQDTLLRLPSNVAGSIPRSHSYSQPRGSFSIPLTSLSSLSIQPLRTCPSAFSVSSPPSSSPILDRNRARPRARGWTAKRIAQSKLINRTFPVIGSLKTCRGDTSRWTTPS